MDRLTSLHVHQGIESFFCFLRNGLAVIYIVVVVGPTFVLRQKYWLLKDHRAYTYEVYYRQKLNRPTVNKLLVLIASSVLFDFKNVMRPHTLPI